MLQNYEKKWQNWVSELFSLLSSIIEMGDNTEVMSIFRGSTFVVTERLHTSGHALNQWSARLLDLWWCPYLFQTNYQLGFCVNGSWMDASLDNCPEIFDRWHVRRVGRPLHHLKTLLLEEIPDCNCLVARCVVLLECTGASTIPSVDLWQKTRLECFSVIRCPHCPCDYAKWVSAFPTETAPYHHSLEKGTMLDGLTNRQTLPCRFPDIVSSFRCHIESRLIWEDNLTKWQFGVGKDKLR